MKKTICLFLTILLSFALFACSGEPESPSAAEDSSSSTESLSNSGSTVTVTLPEGLTLVEIAEKLEKSGVCPAKDFVSAAQDVGHFRESLGFGFLDEIDETIPAFALEGFLFPDTYEFYVGENPYSAVSRFLKNFNSKLSDDFLSALEKSGLSLCDAVTLASMIQDECSFEGEMKNVSSVFVNRLDSSSYGKLQSDVTINYVNKYITDSPYLDDTAGFAELYNTYKCDGLPVGAVCCPGLAALRAAVEPAETSYYFFVTDADMNYYYAETYEEHLSNCEKCGY